DVHFVGQLRRPVDAGTRGRQHARVAGDVAVVVELHLCSLLLLVRGTAGAAVPPGRPAHARLAPMMGLAACSASCSVPSGMPVRSRMSRVAASPTAVMPSR